MEVLIPSQSLDLDFDFNSPHTSAPSTPKRFGSFYCSAPTSPSRLAQFYRSFDDLFDQDDTESATAAAGGGGNVPFDWEEKPGTPKSPGKNSAGDDFEFNVYNDDWETASVAADELFDGGVIKPLKPPPRLQFPAVTSPRKSHNSPISQTRKMIQGAFSPRHRSNSKITEIDCGGDDSETPPQRGRERRVNSNNVEKSASRRAARSLSPLRDTQYPWEDEKQPPNDGKIHPSDSSIAPAAATKSGSQKKWRLMDFFLFRSASEGRAADKDPLKKHTAAIRHSSFRVTDRSGSGGSGSGSRRKRVSAHEMHYTVNRAVAADLKKKTFLPYKQGILGRLAFNPTVHALSNGFGFSRK